MNETEEEMYEAYFEWLEAERDREIDDAIIAELEKKVIILGGE